jgi:MoaA/NifB/PqqE/SkfB family radical SAM enzyme
MIRFLELELSSRCNASCSVCPRFEQGKLNKNFAYHDLSLEVLQNNISKEIWDSILSVTLKGTVGDASFNPHLKPILDFLSEKDTKLHTNGSNRNAAWWQSIVRENLITRFCIDGTDSNVHSRYRHTDFDRVMSNAKSYIAAGGRAEWFFIVFNHNQHQLDAAKQMAKDLGFESFEAIYSDRYTDQPDSLAPYDNLTSLRQIALESRIFIDPTARRFIDWSDNNDLWSINRKRAPVKRCPALQDKAIYIASDGIVWPCCYYGSSNLTKNDLLWKIFKTKVLKNDTDSMNINCVSLDTILQNSAWQWWDDYVTMSNPKTCQERCG